MKVAITGASGHLGANLCRKLLHKNFHVKALIHKNIKSIDKLSIEKIEGSISNTSKLEELCSNTDIVIHLAAIISINTSNKNNLFEVNTKGTENIIKACLKKNVKRLIYFSTIHTLQQEPIDKPLNEERPLVNSSRFIYEQTKAAGERIVHKQQQENNLETIIINPTSIIGPFDYRPSLMGQVLIKLYKQRLPGLVKGGYDWVDVRDVAEATINAIDKGRNGEKYILGGKWVSLRDFSFIVEKVINKKTPRIIFPEFLAKISVPINGIMARINNEQPLYTYDSLSILQSGNKKIDHSKAQRELDFNPRPLEVTIRDTYKWFKQNNYIK